MPLGDEDGMPIPSLGRRIGDFPNGMFVGGMVPHGNGQVTHCKFPQRKSIFENFSSLFEFPRRGPRGHPRTVLLDPEHLHVGPAETGTIRQFECAIRIDV